jgi:hypothetical protein
MSKLKPTKMDLAKQIVAALYNMPAMPDENHHYVRALVKKRYGDLDDQAKVARKILAAKVAMELQG